MRLRHILLSWKQAKEGRLELEEDVPDQLCYLLDHEYSKVNLLASALKGTDARLVAQLAPIATELNFGLFIANIELYKSGPGDDCGGGYDRRRRGRWGYDDTRIVVVQLRVEPEKVTVAARDGKLGIAVALGRCLRRDRILRVRASQVADLVWISHIN